MCKELGRLSQGYKGHTEGTKTLFLIDQNAIQRIPTDQTATYARVVADYIPQMADPYRFRVIVGGNLLNVPGNLSTRTEDMKTSKLLLNSVISTDEARFSCIDIKNMYL